MIATRLLRASVILVVVLPCCTCDSTTEPTTPTQYRVQAYLAVDPGWGSPWAQVILSRRNPQDPAPKECRVTLDGMLLAYRGSQIEDEALFADSFGVFVPHTYIVEIALDDRKATATLATPPGGSLMLVEPGPADTLFFPGEPIRVAWEYQGPRPAFFDLNASTAPAMDHIPTVYHEQMSPNVRDAILSAQLTMAWLRAERATVTVHARHAGAVRGELAADSSCAWIGFPLTKRSLRNGGRGPNS